MGCKGCRWIAWPGRRGKGMGYGWNWMRTGNAIRMGDKGTPRIGYSKGRQCQWLKVIDPIFQLLVSIFNTSLWLLMPWSCCRWIIAMWFS